MKKLGKEQYLTFVEYYRELERLVYHEGRFERNTSISPEAIEWLYDNGFITKQEVVSIGRNKEEAKNILSELGKLLDKFCSGCSLCSSNCSCDNVRLMAAKRRIYVDEEKWMGANGAGGGSLPYSRNLEIPEICAKSICKGFGWTMRDFNREMQ